ncbi:MAG TPA: NAD(P)H-dependent oxidoreductase subunit E [Candidatus Latescibacteria bacterium]|nr:NAD(P)H-dependent oxidoreductase subunit E [Candidatus Latescibacterota bacterium]
MKRKQAVQSIPKEPETRTDSCEPTEEELLRSLDAVIDGYSNTEGALIPVLQSAQNLFGYLPETVLRHISTRLKLPYSQVTGVVTFYSFFSTVPRGEHVVRVCLGTACYVRGGKEVLATLRKQLGINVGESTEDRKFSLAVGRCFGACSLAPAVMVDETVHQRVRPAKVKDLLAMYREAKPGLREAS